jgi:Domain of unknown function (DUF4234)
LSESEEPSPSPPEPSAPNKDAAAQAPSMAADDTGSSGNQGPIGTPRGVAFVTLISILTLGIYHLYWVFKVFEEMKQHTGEGIGGVLGLVIALVIDLVNFFIIPSEVGKMYRGDGRSAPMTGWTGLWVVLPIVGWFVWTVKVQRALNRYWESKAATAVAA